MERVGIRPEAAINVVAEEEEVARGKSEAVGPEPATEVVQVLDVAVRVPEHTSRRVKGQAALLRLKQGLHRVCL